MLSVFKMKRVYTLPRLKSVRGKTINVGNATEKRNILNEMLFYKIVVIRIFSGANVKFTVNATIM